MDYKLNILIAYPYINESILKKLVKYRKRLNFVLDSGAFTAWKSGNPIKLDDYCKFIESLPFEPWRYFTLDKIGDPEGSFKNYEIMLQRGFKPIPIFTRGESISMIDEYYKTSDVLGLGGLVGTKGNKGFVKGVMDVVGKRKVHWLGFTNKDFVSYYKPYMCDCSSWSYVSRYGNMFIYDFKGGFHSIYRKDFNKRPPKHITNAIIKIGFDPNEFALEESWRGEFNKSMTLTAKSYLLKSMDAHNIFKTNMFLACGAHNDIEIFIKLLDEMK